MTPSRMTGTFKMLCQAFLVALMLAFAVADNATTNAVSAFPSYFNNSALTLTVSVSESLQSSMSFTVFPLTAGAGLNGTTIVLNNTRPRGLMRSVDQTYYNISNNSNLMIYLACDLMSDGFMNVTDAILNSVMVKKPTAIILYSLLDDYCSLGGEDLTFNSIFTMTSKYDAMLVQSSLSRPNTVWSGAISYTERDPSGGSSTNDSGTASDDEDDTNNSAVAMSILYSITGLVTLLFLIIIATGAVRAHRHPERYGPRVGYAGRPGQSRAKGIARAVLETIPIVKFGDPNPVKGDPGHDLESMPREQPQDPSNPEQDITQADAREETKPADEAATEVTTDTMTTATKAADPPSGEETAEEEGDHPGCTICAEDFKLGEDVRVLPCNHQYHPACIDPWLVNVSGTCPLCRLDLRPRPTTESSDQMPTVTEGAESGTAPASDVVDESDATERPRRRSRLDWNTLRHAPPHERVLALRELRERLEEERQQRQQRSDDNSSEDRSRHSRFAERLRDRFHIRTRTQARRQSRTGDGGENSSTDPPEAAST